MISFSERAFSPQVVMHTGIVKVVDVDRFNLLDGGELFVLAAPATEGGEGVCCAVHDGALSDIAVRCASQDVAKGVSARRKEHARCILNAAAGILKSGMTLQRRSRVREKNLGFALRRSTL